MTRPDNFQDVEVALMELLRGNFTEFVTPADGQPRAVTATPPNMAALLPMVRVGLVSGTDDAVTDFSSVDVDVFGSDRESTRLLAERVRTFFLARPHRVNDYIIDAISTQTKPRPLPWDIKDVHRYGATYYVSARR